MNELEDHIKISDEILTPVEKIAYLEKTLLLGPKDIESLTISKDANFVGNIVLSVNKASYDLKISKMISPELVKFIFENEYYVQILVNDNLVSSPLKIININMDHNMSYNIRIRLEE